MLKCWTISWSTK